MAGDLNPNDEPSSALDPPGKLSLADLLHSVASSINIAAHDVEFASRTRSRFLVISENRLYDFNEGRDAEQCLLGNLSGRTLGETPH